LSTDDNILDTQTDRKVLEIKPAGQNAHEIVRSRCRAAGAIISMPKEKTLDELAAWQSEQWEQVQKASRNWIDRMQSEVKLASELSNKLTAAHSMPEVATACQEWASRHMEMAAQDANRIVADGQKLVETGTRLLTKGWRPNITGGSS
jgi:hypothetical protein